MPQPLEAYYDRYSPMVHRRCLALLKDGEEAMDATQDVFVEALRRRETLSLTAASSWLYCVATHVCLNRLRHRRRHPESPEEALIARAAALDDPEAQSTASLLLQRFFGREPPSAGVLVVLHFVDGLTLEETAAELGLSVSGVRKRLRQLKNKLQLFEENHA